MTDEARGGKQRFAVLEVFGVKLQVSNPTLAELLTMDAAEALTADIGALSRPRVDRAEITEAALETVISPPTAASEYHERSRLAFRAAVDGLGSRLGFEVRPDGTWLSPVGIRIHTRTVERSLTAAAAAHFVNEVSALSGPAQPDTAVLFIVDSQETADVFRFAIRQRHLHHLMRTVSRGNLAELCALHDSGALDHRKVLVLLAPVADIDVGEMLSVLHANQRASDER